MPPARPIARRDDWIELSDGCRLFARTVLPADAERVPVPGLLEYLPYRLTDGTARRDGQRHPYFAGHGYASIRVDIRGSGNSDGIPLDEYVLQEQLDGVEVIEWIASQPWCTGAVGMFGKSWGGFNGLQVAARHPPALKAVISAYFTDDRYADDVHYMGGCLLAHEALSWGTHMFGLNALPPDPSVVGDRWRGMWSDRLARTPFFVREWLAHQRRDSFWAQGSICEDFAALDAAVLLVGGWADGYTNAVDRTLTGLTRAGVPCRALVGPWSHGWPELAEPGPTIGFLQECRLWWDHWLKGADNGAMDGPLLRAWMQDYVEPASHHSDRPGRWVTETTWPSPRAMPVELFAAADGRLARAPPPGPAGLASILGSALAGSDAGAWCPYGLVTDFPPDQRSEDGLAMSFTSSPLDEPVEVLGVPAVTLELSVDRPLALVAVRLCDVAPDGASLLIARGLLNLCHRSGHAEPRPMPLGVATKVEVPLDFTSHAFAAGHRIRVAISPTYWPFAWPSPDPVRLTLSVGDATRLTLPCRPPLAPEPAVSFGAPEQTAAAAGTVSGEPWRTLRRELAGGRTELDVGERAHGRLEEARLETRELANRRFSLVDGDPLSAMVECRGEQSLSRGQWNVSVSVRTTLSATAESFWLSHELDAYEGGVRVHSARGAIEIPRDHV